MKFKKSNNGITLVSLVITIIVMLILAGVSLSMVTGDSSVLKQAQKTAFMQEMAGYKEELESQILGKSAEYYAKNLKHLDKETITLAGANMREYISSMSDEDLDDYMIVKGELHYIGDDEFELGICAELGYETKAPGQSIEDFIGETETKAMESIILKMSGGEKFMTQDESGATVEAGLPLIKKTSSSGFGGTEGNWRIITVLENDVVSETYADGWYYVPAKTKVKELGELKYSYIINYTEKRAVKFDPQKHSIIANNGSLAVEDGLVYIADPTNMSDGSSASWGNAILHGFTETVKDASGNVTSGWTDTAFITDGKDDRVELKSNSNFDNGITIEFYGKVLKNNPNSKYEMIFTKGESPDLGQVITLGLDEDIDTAWFGYNGHRHWNIPNYDSKVAAGKQFFISYRISGTDDKGKIYINNEALTTLNPKNNYGTNTWEKIKEMFNDTSKSFYFGYGRGTSDIVIHSNMAINTIRVYNRYLSDDELTANYNATVSYYNILSSGGNADNNNSGGDDWDSVINK